MALTKSEFIRFLDCPRKAWLGRNRRDLRPPMGETVLELLELGKQVTRLARETFPQGRQMPESGTQAAQASESAAALALGDTTLFEASFEADGLFARVDVLVSEGGKIALYEAKSSASVKPEHIVDLAFQWLVVERAGYQVESANVIFVNRDHVPDGAAIRPADFLSTEDVTGDVVAALARIKVTAAEAAACLTLPHQPEVETNKHCKDCDFYPHCHSGQSPLDVVLLPGIRSSKVSQFRRQGKPLVSDLDEATLSPEMARAARSMARGETVVGPDLARALQAIEYPAAFVDFEAANPLFPVIPGLRPYEVFVFQWSCHFLDHPDQDEPSHKSYLDLQASDPRPQFAETLWEAIKHSRTVVHYSNYEPTQVKRLPETDSGAAAALREAFDTRTVDLLKIVKAHVYHPDFGGEFSIKKVLPALVPGMDYKSQAIADGQAAARAYIRAKDLATSQAESVRINQDLLSYCALDTLAMVMLFKKLQVLTR